LSLSPEDLAGVLAGNSGRIKTVITDQKVIAGIGKRLQRRDPACREAVAVRLTAGKLTDAQLASLHDAMISVLTDAVERSVGQQGRDAQGAKKRSGLQVHGPAPVYRARCAATPWREVSFADKSFQYLPDVSDGWQGAGRPEIVAAAQIGCRGDSAEKS